MVGQQRDVLDAISQRRDADVEHVEAEEQVLAETALLDQLRQILVAGRDNAHIDSVRAALLPDLLHLALLEDPQQHDL